MAHKWTTRRPPLRLYGSWEGDNLTELQAAFPDWTFSINPDGKLHQVLPSGQQRNLKVGTWFTTDFTYQVDPTTTEQVQDAPGPGLVSVNLTAAD